jgi:hypothetical protein
MTEGIKRTQMDGPQMGLWGNSSDVSENDRQKRQVPASWRQQLSPLSGLQTRVSGASGEFSRYSDTIVVAYNGPREGRGRRPSKCGQAMSPPMQ